jgi:predicted permease
MRWFFKIRNLLDRIGQRRRLERELDLEMQDHFEQEVEEGIRRGLTPEEARYAAQRIIGSAELYKEEIRDVLGITLFDTIARDLRFAFRSFRRTPFFAITSVATICLGIGANTTVFTFIENILLRGPQVQDPSHLATLAWGAGVDMSYPNYIDFRDRNTTFTGLAGDRFGPVNLSIRPGNNTRVWGYEVTGNYFDLLGLHPQLGRFLTVSDDQQRGAHPVLVISDRLWKSRFGRDPNILGQTVKVNGFPFTIIGVAPENFVGTEMIVAADYWVPISMVSQIEPGSRWTDVRVSQNLWAFGRLKPGVTYRQAEADLDRIVTEIARAYPRDVEANTKIHVAQSGLVGKSVRDPIANFSIVLLTIAATGLLLACVNLAGMLLARVSARQKEIAIRLAVGASRSHLIRQLLLEALLLAIGGGSLGVGLASFTCRLLNGQQFEFGVPFSIRMQPDGRVLAFAVGLTVVTALSFGLLPALQSVRREITPGLHQDDHRQIPLSLVPWTLRDVVVSVQVALSVVLVICSLLVVKSLHQALNVNLGFKQEGAYAMTTDLRSQGYDEARCLRFRRDLLARLRALPGFQAVGIINSLPLNLAGLEGDFYMPVGAPIPDPANRRVTLVYNVSAGYLSAAGTRLLAGRDISEADQKGRPQVALVNEAAARQLFPQENPIGRRFRLSLDPKDQGFEIVGTVETGKYRFLSDHEQPAVFLAIEQVNASWATVVVRSSLPAVEIASALRREALAVDPELTLFQLGSFTEQLALPLFPARVAAIALGIFGALALLLAGTGLFALVAFAVARRAKEMGIRMALGATTSHVLCTVMGRTLVFCGVGVFVGLGTAFFATRLLAAILYGVNPHDPATYTAALGLIVWVAVVACWYPAARAIRLDPARTLREE